MDQMQTVLFIETLTARKEALKVSIKEAKKQSKDLNIFQTYQKGLLDGAVISYENEIEAIDVYLQYLQACEKDKLQKELH
ncbi:hypothetical protein PP654_gp010 [Bacillus phage v_B-Bak10]|uniref:Uncharacterized protein n=2 Tax=Basiliskvirus TaxID=3044670 RepID=A0A385IK44_9CAUD|nr:hypothetical protein PP653_gp012 [Bacillus phage Basilisk]YP_010656919.1 hypothetical protein PP654_gp010 [Bacillus phage v_B-Bak10]AGR46676.1 hypothetical protein BASILISK_12 [Bacillus phage Basilisk]AXY83284.1 hypothetical protein vBBBak10_010 [Bacillus phage v_B-Bak10]